MRLLIAAALLASLAGCKPTLPDDVPGKNWDIVITTTDSINVTHHRFRIHTTRPIQQVEAAAALCAEGVHGSGVDSIGECLRSQGFKPIYIMQ